MSSVTEKFRKLGIDHAPGQEALQQKGSSVLIGEKLEGTVRNVAPFGLFIDIGLHDDGLAHISKLSHNFVKDPSDLYSAGDIVTCYVDSINKEKNKVNLRMYEN